MSPCHQHPHPPPQRGVLAKAGGPTQRFPEDEFASLALALLARPWSRVVHWIKKNTVRSSAPWPAGKSPINGSFNSKIINKFNKGWIFMKPLFEYRRVIAINGGRYYPGKIL